MTTSALFWDRIADDYARRPVKNQTAYEQTLAATRTYLSPRDHVLELGCGTGSTALDLARHVRRVTATDISPRMIEIATAKQREGQAESVEFLVSEPGGETIGWQTYDAVLAFNLLHLVPDLDRTLSDIHRHVRPGGVLISKSPCLGEMSFLIRGLVRGMQHFGFAPEVTFFKSQDLEASLRWAGFEIVSSQTFDKAPTSRFLVARKPL